MQINNLVLATILICLALIIAAYAMSLPPIPGQDYGADVFPKLVAAGLAGCGLTLALSRTSVADQNSSRRLGGREVFYIALVLATIVGFITIAPILGFIGAASLMIFGLQIFARVRWQTAIVVAATLSPLTFYLFAKVLQVPLPVGILWL